MPLPGNAGSRGMPTVRTTDDPVRELEPSRFSHVRRKRLAAVLVIYAALAGLLAVYGLLSPGAMKATNLLNLARQASPLGLATLGQAVVILTGNGGVDLSTGSVITLTNVVAAGVIAGSQARVPAAMLGAGTLGVLIGAANGLAISRLGIPPLVMTLGTASIVDGLALIYTGGAPKGNIPETVRAVADGWIGGALPVAVVVWGMLALALGFVLARTVFGRWIYATGANMRAATLAGLPVRAAVTLAYIASSLSAVMAGMMLSAYIGVGFLGIGSDYTLNAIAAAVIGGVSFEGGRGTIAGAVAGTLIMVVLQAMLTVMNVSQAGRLVTQGAIITLMVGLYRRHGRSS
jgi:ribose/xylose/arabinose/galactoside ABC-type transport system permease subunit